MITIYFATNRNPNRKNNPDNFGGRFNPEAIDNLRFGVAELRTRRKKLELTSVKVAPEKLEKDHDQAQLGSSDLFRDLRAEMDEGVDTLAFIHGYNVSFEEAMVTGGRIAEVYGQHHAINVVVFSWPSDGSMMPLLAYKRDRTDAAASAPAFARALLKLRDFLQSVERGNECHARIHLMAHSMGNYVLRNGIQEARRHGSVPRLFDQIFLMAADEDDDAFELEHKLRPLPTFGQGVNVYFNRGDTALVISDKTKSNPTRLGSQGPREPLNVPATVTNIDVSEVVEGLVEHGYFVDHEQTVADVIEVIRGEIPQDQLDGRRYVLSQNRYVLV